MTNDPHQQIREAMMSDRNKHIGRGFNAQELFEYLEQFTPEERAARELYIRVGPEGTAFNIKTLDYVEDSTYGFFGKPIPCLILNDERYSPQEEDEDEEGDEDES